MLPPSAAIMRFRFIRSGSMARTALTFQDGFKPQLRVTGIRGGQEDGKVDRKKVLIIEDSEPQRITLHAYLEARGFEVYSAGRVAEARELAEKHWEDLDVAVLDMRLEDPDEPLTTGADIAIEFRRAKRSFPPEFLIFSAFSEVDYYRLALKLGARVYLSKQNDSLSDAVRHVCALALRRALNGENPATADKLTRIAARSQSRSETVVKFCQSVLKPEFEACLGVRFAILLTDENGTRCCASNCNVPERVLPVYSTLQSLAQALPNNEEPFVVDATEVSDLVSDPDLEVLRRFEGAAFLPLSIGPDIRISVGVLKDDSDVYSAAEEPVALVKALAQDIRTTVIECLLKLLSSWTEVTLTRDALLRATAQLCLYLGQEQQAIVSGLACLQEDDVGPPLQKLSTLADDILQTGEILAFSQNITEESYQNVYIAEIIRAAARDVAPEDSISIKGDFEMRASPDLLLIAVSLLLQWLVAGRI